VELFSGQEKGCHGGGGEWLESTKNEGGRWCGERAGQTLNDFHCFQKLSYQRNSLGRRIYIPLPVFAPSWSRYGVSLESSSTPSIEPRCAVYKPCPNRNGTSFELFLELENGWYFHGQNAGTNINTHSVRVLWRVVNFRACWIITMSLYCVEEKSATRLKRLLGNRII